MWGRLARFILSYRWILLSILLAPTVLFSYYASRVQLSYEFSRAIPVNHPKYKAYQAFKQQFGEDGNVMVIAIQTDQFFSQSFFNDYAAFVTSLKELSAIEGVLSIPGAGNLVKDTNAAKITAMPIFHLPENSQAGLDSNRNIFLSLPFYRGLLYNAETKTYLLGIYINKQILNTKKRNEAVPAIVQRADDFGKKYGLTMHYSGLPYIRTKIAMQVADEMRWFLAGSVILSAIILFIFFRSLGATLLSLAVVIIGVIWCLATIHLFGFKITLLTALIPPLVVVIGIPNCIYFLNKFHTTYKETGDKQTALVEMISRMGVVTLFCNIAAAIGFAVFALTRSAILREFGVVAGLNIMALFIISIVLIPAVLSLLKPPAARHMKYLENRWLLQLLQQIESWSVNHRTLIYAVTTILIVASVAGFIRLRAEGFIVDDLPQDDKVYTDLKFFEKHFKGVMPLEVIIDTKKRNGIRSNPLQLFAKIDSFSKFIEGHKEMARPLSFVEGMKFARQGYYDGDSASYDLPNSFDIGFLAPYLATRNQDSSVKQSQFSRVVSSFIDTARQRARVSINMADVGSRRLEELIEEVKLKSNELFDSTRFHVEVTGSSVTFLEGSTFIINGLKESVLWAFLLISACMLYLFRSFRILICSLIPNLIPLIMTAGVMGWAGVRIKPSTVLVFSVALGIAIDITIRFLVNYKQEMELKKYSSFEVVKQTIHKTGISIIYTSLVLIVGFIIFCFSGFGGTKALGWLTSLTLVLATITNLVLLPSLLMTFQKNKQP
ncbi:MAG TPA: efflux RND transporter permease subunit [Flavitalea sp.]|nr:efflux RND transporter permease subunit [Flavitalea sp.]